MLLLLAVLGLTACSLYTIGEATQDDIAGSPHHFLYRQVVFVAVGLCLMLAISRLDYSRLREWKLQIYGALIAGIMLVFALGSVTKGSRARSSFGFFELQSSEVGKVLLILALAAVIVDRVRQIGDRQTTAVVMLLALVPAMLVIVAADLGSGMVYIVDRPGDPLRRRDAVDSLRGARRARGGRRGDRF